MKRIRTYKSIRAFVRAQRRERISERRAEIQAHPEKEQTIMLLAELRREGMDERAMYEDPMSAICPCMDEISGSFRRKFAGVFGELCSRGVLEYDGDCVTRSHYNPAV